MPAEARISGVVTLTGRGTVLMLEPDFSGRIHLHDMVTSSRSQAIVLGAEVATSGWSVSWLTSKTPETSSAQGDPLRRDSPAHAAEP